MSWQLASFLILAAVLIGGFAWYERSRPTSQVVALVAALAALAAAGRVAFVALPNVVATTDIVVFAGYALGAAPGFAVGALAGLVANFWLGQGPWTPWQMAGWGLCGILGAMLALGVRNAGRLTLAAVCAAAAVGYGALLNFSLMATYGGELTLQRFLALESAAVPFDLAHAAGNVVFALIAGPAMVRMLIRFRERFEWRVPAAATALLAALVVATSLPAAAQAAGADRAARWLTSQQNADGGWGSSTDDDSSAATTGWAMLGLAAAGRHPLDVRSGRGRTPVDFLRANLDEVRSSGDFARTVLALQGAGVNPRSFGGRNLVSALLKRRRSNGSFEGWPGSTAFAILALRNAGATGGLDRSISWLAKAQNRDGGWGDLAKPPSTADGTGAAMQAIPGTKAARSGLGYLRKAQRPSGGFPLGGDGAVNSQSTAWAVQGMVAVGANPNAAPDGGKGALDYLAARQAGDGHYRYSSSSDQTPVWVTGQVLAATARKAFPVSPPPRAAPSAESRSQGEGGAASPSPSTGAGSEPSGSAPSLPSFEGAPGATSPDSGAPPPATGTPAPATPGGAGVPSTPPSPGTPIPDGESPEALGATPEPMATFTAGDNPGPPPWAPLGIGLGTGGLALGAVLFLGRRFGW